MERAGLGVSPAGLTDLAEMVGSGVAVLQFVEEVDGVDCLVKVSVGDPYFAVDDLLVGL